MTVQSEARESEVMFFTVARHTVRVSYLIIGIILITLAVFTAVARVGLPLASGYKDNIEARVSDYLKSPVDIGELKLKWEGFGPLLQASEVSVFETDDRAVTLDEVLIDINLAKSLLRGIPIINELSLVGASLALEKDASGEIRVHGMQEKEPDTDLSANTDRKPDSGVDVLAWLFNARKVGLLDTSLTFIDQSMDLHLVVDELNLRAENVGDTNQLRIEAQLPEALGGLLVAGIDFIGDSDALEQSSGNLYFSVNDLDVQVMQSLLQSTGLLGNNVPVSDGLDARASLELWGDWQDGQIVSVQGPLQLDGIRSSGTVQSGLESLSAALMYARTSNESIFSARLIQAELDSSATLSQLGDLQLTVPTASVENDDDNQSAWQLTGSSDELPLNTVSRIAALLLSNERPKIAQELIDADARGSIQSLSIEWDGTASKPNITASGILSDVALSGQDSLPTLGPLNGALSLIDSQGSLQIESQQMPFAWAGLNDKQPVVDNFVTNAELDFRDLSRVQVGADIVLQDNGIDTSSRLKLTLVKDQSPHIDLQTRYSASDVSELEAWLPQKIIGSRATNWFENSIVKGEARNGSVLMFGKLSDFPFTDGDGVFKISVDLNDAALDFLPAWPQATALEGTVELDGLSLSAFADSGSIDEFGITTAKASIANLAVPVLQFSATADGELQELLSFATQGPLKSYLQPALDGLSGTGEVQMDLDLGLALYNKPPAGRTGVYARNWKPFEINGSLFLEENDVFSDISNIEIADATGAINYDENGISIGNVRGKVLGHDINLSGGTQGVGSAATTHLNFSGAIEANDLLAHYENPLDQFVRGASQWQVKLSAPHSAERIKDEGVTLSISSDLVGSELLLPIPFDKSSSQAVPFSLTTAFNDEQTQQWRVQYGDQLGAYATLENESLSSLLIELGQSGNGSIAAAAKQPGIRLQGKVDALAADGWIETVAQYINSFPAGTGDPTPILPISTALKTDKLILGQRSFGEANLRSNSDETYLNLSVTNTAVQGNLRFPREHWSKETPVKARVEKLDWSVIDALSADASSAGGSSNDGGLDPSLLPPVEARVSLITRNNIRVRNLILRAKPNGSGLDITTLGFAYETMRLVGQGYWNSQDPQNVNPALTGKQKTQLNLVLQSDDFGVGLEQIGLSGIIDDAVGTIEMKLDWPGPLYSPTIANLDGSVRVDVQAGSIVQLEPGAGRVFGLFALQALPRRLKLDFKDLTGAGLAFKSIAGTADINNGVADVPLLQLKGPIGVVDIIGQSDLNTQEFDQQVTVLPRVSAALPLIGAISGGASAGIGALVAAGFLKALGVDFDRIGLRTYTLTGPWFEPAFTPVPTDYLAR